MFTVSVLLPFLIMANLLLSTYAYYVELRVARAHRGGENYQAYCDVGAFSCTRVFTSEYGSITQFVGLPAVSNALLGVVFYLLELILCRNLFLMLWLAAFSCVFSLLLFLILVFVLRDLCLVCCSMYIVNVVTYAIVLWSKRQEEGALGWTSRPHID
uniref:vitamin-K-epoxide reductase (warfarin-sensitive) n=1 Tax=Trypanosoma congolense (strain IL3000) TaxID=1068625 RepID=G0UJH5_TRYCI|nr:unnamed protein product [Trypanosoma congolense IL3000]